MRRLLPVSWVALCLMITAGCGGPPKDEGELGGLGGGRPPDVRDGVDGCGPPPAGDAGGSEDAGGPEDAGGVLDAGGPEDAGHPPALPPKITRFLATPSGVERGEQVVLEWEVADTTRLRIEPGLGEVTGSRVTVSPTATTTYTLTAVGEDPEMTLTQEVTVVVTEPPPSWDAMSWGYELPGNYKSDVYRWLDSRGEQRSAALTRNDAKDPGGGNGGMLRQFRYGAGAKARIATGTGASSKWYGWGYVVSHSGSGNSVITRSADQTGQYRQLFLGRHHAIHEFSWDLPIGGVSVKTTVQWFFATGHDHPVYAITFDSSAALPNGLSTGADSRAPYGDIAWDGDGRLAVVDGVKWGDKYKFFSRDEPLKSTSRWDYSTPNVVPYSWSYSRTADAEMGVVQTLSWLQHNTGGTWFNNNWGKTSDNQVDDGDTWLMPANWNWPYQLCQYELKTGQTTNSKRVAWGLMSGSVGKASYDGYGYEKKWSSLPYQSYSVFMVLGRPSEESVQTQITQVERLLKATPYATHGQVVEQGPGGVARADNIRYDVAGYNGVYGVHEFRAEADGFSVRLNAAGGELHNPIFLIRDVAAPLTSLTLDGVKLRADVDYFASYEADAKRLWITVNRAWSGSHTLSNLPATP